MIEQYAQHRREFTTTGVQEDITDRVLPAYLVYINTHVSLLTKLHQSKLVLAQSHFFGEADMD